MAVVALGQVLRYGQQPEADDLEALAFEATDDLADEPALDRVGLGEDERALHDEVRSPQVLVARRRRSAARS
jgi:hypothetical protein